MSQCTKVAGCRREAGHRGAHVGHDGKRIPKGAGGPPRAESGEASAGKHDGRVSVMLTRAQLKLLLEAADQAIKDAIEATKMDAAATTHAVREAVARYLEIEHLCQALRDGGANG
jgi:hypothetical protein